MAGLDLSGFGELTRMAESFDVRGILDGLQRNATRAAEVAEQERELTGRAASDDELIAAAWTPADGLHELTLDPRAMRLPSADLAAEVARVVNAARADLARQRAELVAALPLPDLDDSRQMLRELSADYGSAATDIQALLERMHTQAFGR